MQRHCTRRKRCERAASAVVRRMLPRFAMRGIAAIAFLLGGCDLYFGHHGQQSGSGSSNYAYRLTVDHMMTTDERIVGVDSDGNGGLWIATQHQPDQFDA
jgi:hypothetical protein